MKWKNTHAGWFQLLSFGVDKDFIFLFFKPAQTEILGLKHTSHIVWLKSERSNKTGGVGQSPGALGAGVSAGRALRWGDSHANSDM